MHSSVLISFLFALTPAMCMKMNRFPPGQRNIDLHRHEYKINCPQAVVASPPRLHTSLP